MKIKKALVTGAAGFLGRHCAKELFTRGYEVTGLDILPFTDNSNWGISSYHFTDCNLHSLTNITSSTGSPHIIVHCAGSGSVPSSFQNPHHDFQSNVVTTLNVLEYCRLNPSIKVSIPSSAAVYGNAKTLPILEETPPHPVSPYGVHKKMIEDLARSYAENFKVKVAIVRYFSLYGVGLKKQILWDSCQKASLDDFTFSGMGDEIRDFIHVSDAANLLCQMAEFATTECPIVNGGTGHGISIKEIVELVGNNWNPKKSPHFSGVKRIGDPTHYIADVNRLKDYGFEPKANLHKEICQYVEWYLSEFSV